MTSYATTTGTTWPGDASACARLRRVEPPQGGSVLPSRSRRLVAAVLWQFCSRRAGCDGGDAARDDAGDHEPPVQRYAVAQPEYPLHLYQCRRHGADAFGPDRRGDQAPWRRVSTGLRQKAPNTNSRSSSTRYRTRPRRQASPPLPRSYRRRRSCSVPTILLCRSSVRRGHRCVLGQAHCAIRCTAPMPRRCCRAWRKSP